MQSDVPTKLKCRILRLDKVGRQLGHLILGSFPSSASSSPSPSSTATAATPRATTSSCLQHHGMGLLDQLVELVVAVDAALSTGLLTRQLRLTVTIFNLIQERLYHAWLVITAVLQQIHTRIWLSIEKYDLL